MLSLEDQDFLQKLEDLIKTEKINEDSREMDWYAQSIESIEPLTSMQDEPQEVTLRTSGIKRRREEEEFAWLPWSISSSAVGTISGEEFQILPIDFHVFVQTPFLQYPEESAFLHYKRNQFHLNYKLSFGTSAAFAGPIVIPSQDVATGNTSYDEVSHFEANLFAISTKTLDTISQDSERINIIQKAANSKKQNVIPCILPLQGGSGVHERLYFPQSTKNNVQRQKVKVTFFLLADDFIFGSPANM